MRLRDKKFFDKMSAKNIPRKTDRTHPHSMEQVLQVHSGATPMERYNNEHTATPFGKSWPNEKLYYWNETM